MAPGLAKSPSNARLAQKGRLPEPRRPTSLSSMGQVYDVAILGANAPGYAAAHRLARKGAEVIVIKTPDEAADCPLADWAGPELFKIPGLPRGVVKASGAEHFSQVHYHNASLQRKATFKSRGIAGYFLPAQRLGKTLREAAHKAGVKTRTAPSAPSIELREDSVQLAGDSRVTSRLLIIASGRPEQAIRDLAMPARALIISPFTSACFEVPLPPREDARDLTGALHVIEMTESSELGMFFVVDSVLHLRVISSSSASGARVAELSTMIAKLQEAGIVPPELPLAEGKGAAWRPPAGVALELETHTAKRCLLAGTAGGFAAAVTGQTLTVSIKSATLAADVAYQALNSNDPQETLMAYEQSWRDQLGPSLQPPKTDIKMLLPLIFANERAIGRLTGALLYGERL